jgi:hypothetical protein
MSEGICLQTSSSLMIFVYMHKISLPMDLTDLNDLYQKTSFFDLPFSLLCELYK